VLRLLDLIGLAVFAASGALAAGRKQLDLLGVVVLATVTAVGGGTLRDVLLDRHPIAWLADPTPFVVVLVAALATVLWTRAFRPPWYAILVADALGLALFSVSGAQIAERSGVTTIVGVVVLGTMTGVAGGVLRDLLSAEIPLVLRRGNLYASAAIAGTLAYRLLEMAGVPTQAAAFTGMAIVAGVRFAAIRWRLSLPTYSVPAQTDEYPAPGSRTGRGPSG
jgi:uncharacterized membrane protein YeiH